MTCLCRTLQGVGRMGQGFAPGEQYGDTGTKQTARTAHSTTQRIYTPRRLPPGAIPLTAGACLLVARLVLECQPHAQRAVRHLGSGVYRGEGRSKKEVSV